MRGGCLPPFRDLDLCVQTGSASPAPCRAETFGSSGTLISRQRPAPLGRRSDSSFHVLSPPTGATSQQFASHELSSRPRSLSVAGDTNGS